MKDILNNAVEIAPEELNKRLASTLSTLAAEFEKPARKMSKALVLLSTRSVIELMHEAKTREIAISDEVMTCLPQSARRAYLTTLVVQMRGSVL